MVYVARILSSSHFQNSKPCPHIQSETPEIDRRSSEFVPTLATTPTSNYFRSVRRRRNLRVPLHSSRRELCPGGFDSSIRPTVHPQSMVLCLAPKRVVFSHEPPPLLYLGFLRVLRFPVRVGPPSPYPGGGGPPPSISPRRGPLPFPAAASPIGSAGARPRAPQLRARVTRGRAAGSTLSPSVAPSSLPPCPMVERKEKREGRRW
jgi:hypothetical protein